MKKLLLVLLVVALASFLLVGCLPGTTPDDDEDEDDGDDVIVPVTIAVDKQYTDPTTGITYVKCSDKVIVTLPEAVDVDYIIKIAQKVETAGVITYVNEKDAAPKAGSDRKIWTVTYDFLLTDEEVDCEAICLVAILKHPCCPGEEVALEVVTVDCTPPELDLFVKFTDCKDVCVIPDPCVPEVPGAYMEWTSRTTGLCETTDCCKDACSGVNGWSLVIDADPCLGPCDTVTGTGCPVEGALECGCLIYDDPATTANEGIHYVDFSFEDKVGNAVKSTWKLTFDSDSLVTFEVDDTPSTVFTAERTLLVGTTGWYTVYNDCAVAE
jgi:hypothetical protein